MAVTRWKDFDFKQVTRMREQGFEWTQIAKKIGVRGKHPAATLQNAWTRHCNPAPKKDAYTNWPPGKHGESRGGAVYLDWRELDKQAKAGQRWEDITEELGLPANSRDAVRRRGVERVSGWSKPNLLMQKPRPYARTATPSDGGRRRMPLGNVNRALAKSNGHHAPVEKKNGERTPKERQQPNGEIDTAVARMFATLEENGVIYAEIDTRNGIADIAQIRRVTLRAS